MLPAAFVHNVPLVVLLLCIGYFAAQVPVGCLWTLASDIAPASHVASLGAIQNFGGFLGAAVAPIVTGIILERTNNNYTWVFLVAGILLLFGAVCYGFFVRPTREAQTVEAR